MLWKCCAQYVNKFGILSRGHRTGKGQFSFQSQRRPVPKNVQTTVQVCLCHMLARLCSKSFKVDFSSVWTENFQMYKLGLEKAEKPEIKLPTSIGLHRKQGNFRKTSASFIMLKPLTVWIIINCGKFLKRWEYQTTLPVSWEMCMQVKKQQLEPDMEQQTGSKLGKEYVKAVSVQFSHSVVSDSLWPHESQHTRPPCPSPTPGVHTNSCPSSRWCHPAISSSVVPFSSCP